MATQTSKVEHVDLYALMLHISRFRQLIKPVHKLYTFGRHLYTCQSPVISAVILVVVYSVCLFATTGFLLFLSLTFLLALALVGVVHARSGVLRKILPGAAPLTVDNHDDLMTQYKLIAYVVLTLVVLGVHLCTARTLCLISITVFLTAHTVTQRLRLLLMTRHCSAPHVTAGRENPRPGTEQTRTGPPSQRLGSQNTLVQAPLRGSASCNDLKPTGDDVTGTRYDINEMTGTHCDVTSGGCSQNCGSADTSAHAATHSDPVGDFLEAQSQRLDAVTLTTASSPDVRRRVPVRGGAGSGEGVACGRCSAQFSLLRRRYTCTSCEGVYCSKCCHQKVPRAFVTTSSPSSYQETTLVCEDCYPVAMES